MTPTHSATPAATTPIMTASQRVDLPLALGVTSALLAVVWAEPRPADDLYIALAAGREALAGRLGAPDDWSFTTGGHVWVNQNWGSGVLFYVANAAFGEIGLLLAKAALLVAGATFLALACRARGVAWSLAVLTAGAAFAAGRSYIDLRPNLLSVTLTSLLLWIISRADREPRRLWLALPVIVVWANVHGGYVFGLMLLGMWALASLPAARDHRGENLIPLATLVGAVALAGTVNPFGMANLTHSFTVAAALRDPRLAEWVPLFTSDLTAYGTRWEFCLVVALVAVLALLRIIAARRATFPSASAGEALRSARRQLAFDGLAGLLVVAMALRARRFVPLAVLVLAPMLAAQLEWWRRRLAWTPMVRVLALGLLAGALVAAPPLLRRYAAENPVFRNTTTLQRMLDSSTSPAGAAAFLRDNGIRGRAYAAWEWEGFLRWSRTPVQPMIGGRAQQVYDEPTLRAHLGLVDGTLSPRTELGARGVGLAILPMTAAYAAVLNGLVYDDGSTWAFVFCDGRHAVVADTAQPANAALVAGLADGALRYPSATTAALSRAMYLASPSVDGAPGAIRAAAEEAAQSGPSPLSYAILGDLAINDRIPRADLIAFLASERVRLATLESEDGFALARARVAIARVEVALAKQSGRVPDAVASDLDLRTRETRALLERWAYGWDPNVF